MTYTMKKINIGSVSHATMRPEDLIPAFIDELLSQTPTRREHLKLIKEIRQRIGEALYSGDYYDTDDCVEDLDDLFTALDSYSLPYFYFGAHPGNGSDYGYWLSEDWQEQFDGIIESDNGFRSTFTQNGKTVDACRDCPAGCSGNHAIPREYSGELVRINDHGNVTLYRYSRGRSHEVWSVV